MGDRLLQFVIRVLIKNHRSMEWLPVFVLSQSHGHFITTFGEAKAYVTGAVDAETILTTNLYKMHKRKMPDLHETIYTDLPVLGIKTYSIITSAIDSLRFSENSDVLGLVVRTK